MRFDLENIEDILKIVFFIIVAISSAIASLWKKRQGQQQAPEEAPAQPAAVPPPGPRERRAVERPQSVADEMRMALETIFNAKQPQPARAPVRAASKPSAGTAVKSAARADDSEWGRSVSDREAKSAAKEAARSAEKAAARAGTTTEISGMGGVETGTTELATQALSGVVWSEILRPPVSMR